MSPAAPGKSLLSNAGGDFRICRDGRLIYYRRRADRPEFWSDYWSQVSIRERLKKARQGGGAYYRDLLGVITGVLPKEGRILEAGCGIGEIVWALQSRGYNIEGVDFTAGTVKLVQQAAPKVNIKVGDIFKLEYPDNCFDAYISLGVVEHYEEGPQKALLEARRVLKGGGILVLSVPFFNPLRKVKSLLSRGVTPVGAQFYQYAFCRSEFMTILSRAGFGVNRAYAFNPIAGLKAEVPGLALLLSEDRLPGPVLRFIQSNSLSRTLAAHMILFIAEKPRGGQKPAELSA